MYWILDAGDLSLEYCIENNQVVNIPDNSLNMTLFLKFDNCSKLIELIIGDDCFMKVNQFDLDGLNSLQSIKIGDNSFTTEKDRDGDNKCRDFCIKNCNRLKSIEIGQYSFSDYAGQFQLSSIVW